jgi:hypothetical protein
MWTPSGNGVTFRLLRTATDDDNGELAAFRLMRVQTGISY